MAIQKKKKRGRPTIYSEELTKTICKRISEGESLRAICREEKMPHFSTVLEWIVDGKHKAFSDQYERACNSRAENMFDEILEISDGSVVAIVGDDKSDGARVNARKLQVETRKWYLSRLLPKKFGDKLDLTSGGKVLPQPIYGGKSDGKKV